jgi:ribosome biogenesis protein Nip4
LEGKQQRLREGIHSSRSYDPTAGEQATPSKGNESQIGPRGDKSADNRGQDCNKKAKNMKCQLKCFYTNMDSLNNKRAELDSRLALSKPDIIGIVEVNPKNATWKLSMEELQRCGYTTYFNLNGRGVVLYINDSLSSSEIESTDNVPAVWCEVVLKDNDRLLIGVVYRSPSASAELNKSIIEMLTAKVSRNSSHLLLMGDFNLPGINWELQLSLDSDLEQEFLDCFNDFFVSTLKQAYSLQSPADS